MCSEWLCLEWMDWALTPRESESEGHHTAVMTYLSEVEDADGIFG